MTGRATSGHAAPVSEWLRRFAPDHRARARLFCFPYAGGAANVFASWVRELGLAIDLLALQLPGRGARITEPPIADAGELVEAACRAVAPLTDVPYVMFGHSMGGRVAYEVCARLQSMGGRLPLAMIVSAALPPDRRLGKRTIHNLPRSEFISELRALGGTPEEILDNVELLDLLEPALRADFRLVETWENCARFQLTVPIYALGGLDDQYVTRTDLTHWSHFTARKFSLTQFEGGHFFLDQVQNSRFFPFMRKVICDLIGGSGATGVLESRASFPTDIFGEPA